ncbi:hypothetical protein FMEAI12_3660004 [Parafrankia sp. Ea1.12]|nr:hypothetical protein FMEAI12_3660004 [Parafrankia sp. Ea1.12]
MLHCRPESLLTRSRTVTACAGVPFHCGTQVAAESSSRRSPSPCAMPTSVDVSDFVMEKTGCGVVGVKPLKYHSPAILPLRETSRQLDLPCSAACAMSSSFAGSRPTARGSTVSQLSPGTATAVGAAPDAVTGPDVVAGVPEAPPPCVQPATRAAANGAAARARTRRGGRRIWDLDQP